MNILLTGGTGYIGSHACVALLEAGHAVTILDNFSNSSPQTAKRITAIAGREPGVICGDVRDIWLLGKLMAATRFDAVFHFAGKKAVGESMTVPLDYYSVNFSGTLSLLEAMRDHGVRNLVFSSSATVYGTPESVPVLESSAIHPVNPYGQTKAMVEQVLSDLCASDSSWRIACLRYFNPAGAHPSGLLGEDPADQPNNLMPYLVEVAEGRRPHLNIFGNDYPTIDGTGMRDYIHVTDLVAGHVAALDYLLQHPGLLQVNLGTGTGVSVLQMLHSFEQACGRKIPYQFAPRRPGDIAAYWADPSRAERILDWRAKLDVAAMCRDTWRWRTSQVKQSPPNNAARKLEVAS